MSARSPRSSSSRERARVCVGPKSQLRFTAVDRARALSELVHSHAASTSHSGPRCSTDKCTNFHTLAAVRTPRARHDLQTRFGLTRRAPLMFVSSFFSKAVSGPIRTVESFNALAALRRALDPRHHESPTTISQNPQRHVSKSTPVWLATRKVYSTYPRLTVIDSRFVLDSWNDGTFQVGFGKDREFQRTRERST